MIKFGRVLILKPDNIGDIVLFSGCLEHLRKRFRWSQIELCVRRRFINLVECCPHVDHVRAYEDLNDQLSNSFTSNIPIVDRWRLTRNVYRLVRRSWSLYFTTAILPVRSPTPEMHTVISRIPALKTFGIAGDVTNQNAEMDAEANVFYTARTSVPESERLSHELIIHSRFLSLLGISRNNKDLSPILWTTRADKAWAEQNVPGRNETILLGLAPGAASSNNGAREYLPHSWGLVFAELSKSHLLQVIIFGTAAEREICESTEYHLRAYRPDIKVLNVAGCTTIRQMIEGLRRCDIVVSVETGALHVATALRKPTVGVMGGGFYGRFYPWGDLRRQLVVTNHLPCFGCNWNCLYEYSKCVKDIDSGTIAARIGELIDTIRR